MIISIVNFTNERLKDVDVLKAMRAINRQIDFVTIEAQHSDSVANRRMIELVQSLNRSR